MAQAVLTLCISRKVSLEHQVNRITVSGAIHLPSRNIWSSAENLVEVLNEHLFGWLDVMYQPRSSVCTTRISLNFMINAAENLASSRRLIFGGPVIALVLTEKSLSAAK